MASFSDFYYDSCNGVNSIHARMCKPEGEPRAIVQIAHGIAEHINRYDEFMAFLADNGILAVGEDHLGHGQSFHGEEQQGFFAEQAGWNCVITDLHTLYLKMKEEYPSIPYVFFGHSMGSFLARTYVIKFPNDTDAVILSGTGNQSPLLVEAGYIMAELMVKKNGACSDGKKLNDIAFGSYCKKIENPVTPFDWLSVNSDNVRKYINDPLCGFVAKNGLYRDMMSGIKFVTDKKNTVKMNKAMPVYFMSGKDDPVGDYGKGVDKAYKLFCDSGMHDVTIRLYENGRHEMLNEINHEKVYADILEWINSKK